MHPEQAVNIFGTEQLARNNLFGYRHKARVLHTIRRIRDLNYTPNKNGSRVLQTAAITGPSVLITQGKLSVIIQAGLLLCLHLDNAFVEIFMDHLCSVPA